MRSFLRGLSIVVLTSTMIGCTKFDLLHATVPNWGFSRQTDVVYGSTPRQKLDVYRPANDRDQAAIVIFFYGGNWQSGNKSDYRFVAQALASRGFIAVIPDYRLYPEVKFPAFVQDGALAVRWVHDHASEIGGDEHRIFLMGHSAGAHIAALLTLDGRYLKDVGMDRSDIRATAALSGPYDFVPNAYDLPVFAMSSPDDPLDPNTQPIHFVDGRASPMLLVHGGRDKTVDVENAERLFSRIEAMGGRAKYVLYPSRGHVDVVLSLAWSFRWLAPTLRDCTHFFDVQE